MADELGPKGLREWFRVLYWNSYGENSGFCLMAEDVEECGRFADEWEENLEHIRRVEQGLSDAQDREMDLMTELRLARQQLAIAEIGEDPLREL